MRAAVLADARLDHHDGMLSGPSPRAVEAQERGPCALRNAAASVRTPSTEERPVEASAVAVLMLEAHWHGREVTALTHTPSLELNR